MTDENRTIMHEQFLEALKIVEAYKQQLMSQIKEVTDLIDGIPELEKATIIKGLKKGDVIQITSIPSAVKMIELGEKVIISSCYLYTERNNIYNQVRVKKSDGRTRVIVMKIVCRENGDVAYTSSQGFDFKLCNND